MKTLKELGDFVGIPQGSGDMRFRSIVNNRKITLRAIDGVVHGFYSRSISMRAILQILKNLPTITLEANMIEPTVGEEPLDLRIRVNISEGMIWRTTVYLYPAGHIHTLGGEPRFASWDLDPSQSEYVFNQTSFGQWQIVVDRIGISTTGFVALSQTFDGIYINKKPVAPPPPPPPPPPTPPVISVVSKGDGSFAISGSGFVPPNATVTIFIGVLGIVQNPLELTVTASEGSFRDFLTGNICSNHKGVRLYFWASDGRIHKGQQVKSNQVQLSCPF